MATGVLVKMNSWCKHLKKPGEQKRFTLWVVRILMAFTWNLTYGAPFTWNLTYGVPFTYVSSHL